MQLLVATNNKAKIARVNLLLKGRDVFLVTPQEAGIEVPDVEEGSDILENAERKARAYYGKTDLPILGIDTAFVIQGEDLDPALVKRNALAGRNESDLSQEEIAKAIMTFYRDIAERHGGRAPAFWRDALALVLPDGSVRREVDKRPVILTGEVYGEPDPYFPLRAMYIVEATGKYVADQTPEEELVDLRPFQEALIKLLEL